MADLRVEETQQTLTTLRQVLEALSSSKTASLSFEPQLLQTLLAVTSYLPGSLQEEVGKIIDLIRVQKEVYGSYISVQPDQLHSEQILSRHDDEADAQQALMRIKARDIAGRVARIRVTRSPLPQEHFLANARCNLFCRRDGFRLSVVALQTV